MQTRLVKLEGSMGGGEAESILRACVHCGFCNATCPTYRLLGDELDGPRGRIYQIKQVLEGAPATHLTQLHLDRCLTCRSCETTCPSGVQYGRLLEIGRAVVQAQVRRPLHARLLHWLLRESLTRRGLFAWAARTGRAARFALPASLSAALGRARPPGPRPTGVHARKVLLQNGCVQPSLAPSINTATARVLDAIGVQAVTESRSGCCGAIRQHLDDLPGARRNARRNIDAWWPLLESGAVEALIVNASGCAAAVKDYEHLLQRDAVYADKARRVSGALRDLGAFLAPAVAALPQAAGSAHTSALGPAAPPPLRVALHKPCTLQHTLRAGSELEGLLRALGAQLVPVAEPHLCCGSAGTYSLLQPRLSRELRERKLAQLEADKPELILSANIGCIMHLGADAGVPVWHWIEWVDRALRAGPVS